MNEDIINKLKAIGITYLPSTPLAPESITVENIANWKNALKTLCPDYATTIDGLDDTKLMNIATLYQQILAGASTSNLCTILQSYATNTNVETKKKRNYFLKAK